ncbi:MAG: hypothetical protein Kow0013_07580 [Pararhodobacter sp.]
MERFLRAFRLSRDRDDVLAASRAELDDLGVSRALLLELNALPDDVPARVAAMGKTFGLSDEALLGEPDTWLSLLVSCKACAELPSCHRFMAREEPGTADEVDFCPNAHRFIALQETGLAAR